MTRQKLRQRLLQRVQQKRQKKASEYNRLLSEGRYDEVIKVCQHRSLRSVKWKKSNPNLFKKYKKIYKELLEHPKTGLGHPGSVKGRWGYYMVSTHYRP